MRTHAVLPIVMAAAMGRVSAQEERLTGELGDAPVVEGNPPGLVYEAVLPEEPFFPGVDVEGNVKGSIIATSAPDGVGVEYKVSFSNLPKEGGPFSYHIHVAPVPEGGNCTATLAHLDPYLRGQAIPCDPEAPETCEVGDLSGKHGLIDSAQDPYEATYIDPYSSLIEGQGAFFGNRSFVFHFDSNLTRISCANFELKAEGTPLPPPEDHPDNCTDTAKPSPPPGEEYPPPEEGNGEGEHTSDVIPGVPAPTGGIPSPSSTDGFEPVPTAGAALTAVPFALLGAVVVGGIFGM